MDLDVDVDVLPYSRRAALTRNSFSLRPRLGTPSSHPNPQLPTPTPRATRATLSFSPFINSEIESPSPLLGPQLISHPPPVTTSHPPPLPVNRIQQSLFSQVTPPGPCILILCAAIRHFYEFAFAAKTGLTSRIESNPLFPGHLQISSPRSITCYDISNNFSNCINCTRIFSTTPNRTLKTIVATFLGSFSESTWVASCSSGNMLRRKST